MRLRFTVNAFNLFDEANVANIFPNYLAAGQAVRYQDLGDLLGSTETGNSVISQRLVTDPRYNRASSFQGPRSFRFALGIMF